MAEDLFDLSCINDFEEGLESSLRHCRYASRKLKQLTKITAELKLNNQVNLMYKEKNIDLGIKSILDDVQNLCCKLNTIPSTVDSDNTLLNIGESIQELESIVDIVTKNKNTIFTHRNTL